MTDYEKWYNQFGNIHFEFEGVRYEMNYDPENEASTVTEIIELPSHRFLKVGSWLRVEGKAPIPQGLVEAQVNRAHRKT